MNIFKHTDRKRPKYIGVKKMKDKLYKYLPAELAAELIERGAENALEIRLRAGNNAKIRFFDGSIQTDILITQQMLTDILQQLCGYSLYAYSEDIARGFVTAGGWRVGIGGRVSFSNGECRGIKNVSSLNIRIARQIKGCADRLLNLALNGGRTCGTLIASPPACGKTTLVRDLARQISDSGTDTVIIDERGEIAALGADGIPAFDVGKNTDILSGIKKAEGARMALRSLAPRMIVLDEIGEKNDVQAVYEACTGGCAALCTAHTYSMEALYKRKYIYGLIADGIIEKIVFLKGVGKISAVYDEKGEIPW